MISTVNVDLLHTAGVTMSLGGGYTLGSLGGKLVRYLNRYTQIFKQYDLNHWQQSSSTDFMVYVDILFYFLSCLVRAY